jgi:hypothetical protein
LVLGMKEEAGLRVFETFFEQHIHGAAFPCGKIQ